MKIQQCTGHRSFGKIWELVKSLLAAAHLVLQTPQWKIHELWKCLIFPIEGKPKSTAGDTLIGSIWLHEFGFRCMTCTGDRDLRDQRRPFSIRSQETVCASTDAGDIPGTLPRDLALPWDLGMHAMKRLADNSTPRCEKLPTATATEVTRDHHRNRSRFKKWTALAMDRRIFQILTKRCICQTCHVDEQKKAFVVLVTWFPTAAITFGGIIASWAHEAPQDVVTKVIWEVTLLRYNIWIIPISTSSWVKKKAPQLRLYGRLTTSSHTNVKELSDASAESDEWCSMSKCRSRTCRTCQFIYSMIWKLDAKIHEHLI